MMKSCIYIAALWFILSSVAFSQSQLTPQLKSLLDFYFRGPGASNTVSREQIRDSAIDLSKVDLADLSTYFAARSSVRSLETDPVWGAEKGGYATLAALSGYVTADALLGYVTFSYLASQGYLTQYPYTNSFWATNDFSVYFTGVVTNIGPGSSTNRLSFERGLLKTVETLE